MQVLTHRTPAVQVAAAARLRSPPASWEDRRRVGPARMDPEGWAPPAQTELPSPSPWARPEAMRVPVAGIPRTEERRVRGGGTGPRGRSGRSIIISFRGSALLPVALVAEAEDRAQETIPTWAVEEAVAEVEAVY